MAAPTVAAVKAGTSFAMTAGTPAIVNISGLTASTAYKYYFVAKDAANNDQAAVSAGLPITTAAALAITSPLNQSAGGSGTGSWNITGANSTTAIMIGDNYGNAALSTLGGLSALDPGFSVTDTGGGTYTVGYNTWSENGTLPVGLMGGGDEVWISIDSGSTWYKLSY